MKLEVIKEKACRITSSLEAFDGGTQKWKESFYMLFRYQMTWGFAYEITVRESRRSGVLVDLLVKSAYKTNILNTMEDLGYRDISVSDENVGIVDNTTADIDTFVGEM